MLEPLIVTKCFLEKVRVTVHERFISTSQYSITFSVKIVLCFLIVFAAGTGVGACDDDSGVGGGGGGGSLFIVIAASCLVVVLLALALLA